MNRCEILKKKSGVLAKVLRVQADYKMSLPSRIAYGLCYGYLHKYFNIKLDELGYSNN